MLPDFFLRKVPFTNGVCFSEGLVKHSKWMRYRLHRRPGKP
jgi:hypothetical protein